MLNRLASAFVFTVLGLLTASCSDNTETEDTRNSSADSNLGVELTSMEALAESSSSGYCVVPPPGKGGTWDLS